MSFKAAGSSIRARSIPFLTASALSATLYAVHSATHPALSEDPAAAAAASPAPNAARKVIPNAPLSPCAPLGWGSNKYLVLSEDASSGQVRKPSALAQLGGTPLRDLVLAEKYGAAVDAKGDLWMWGAGYDESGKIGRSLKGKNIRSLTPAPNKIFCLSSSGRLYALSSSRTAQASSAWKSEQSWWSFLFSSSPSADFVELKADSGLKRGERFIGASAGLHHLLAVTNKGRTFSLPVSERGNSHRQLGTREIIEATPDPTHAAADPRFVTTLTEVPSLAGVQIDQVAASSYTSFARTSTGRVLGWGANESGQIGLGPTAIVDVVPTPVEVVLARNYPGGTTLKCLDIQAGGTSTMFTVERDTPGKAGTWVDLLACGNGMTGALGNGLWSSASPSPVRVKTVSGLQEYSEKANAFIPLSIYAVSLAPSPSAHVFAVLDTVREAEAGGVKSGLYGKDVMVWGGNADYQLGNGKRSSLAVPQHLPPLVQRSIAEVGLSKEASISSGALSHMPHSRLQLHQTKTHAYDPEGKLLKRNVKCEEVMVAGWNVSALYNKIIE